jgi:hypothetical protein
VPKYTREQFQDQCIPWLMRYLLTAAVGNTTITYGRISELLQKDLQLHEPVFFPQIAGVVRKLMNRLQTADHGVPLINVLIVNRGTFFPGVGVDSYLRDRYRVTEDPLPFMRKFTLVELASREVYAYQSWAKVYRKAFGTPAPEIDTLALVIGTEQDGLPPASLGKRGCEEESTEHKALKAHVLAHPSCIGLLSVPDFAKDGLVLLSGDEVDVYFETGNRADLVEVKSIRSNWNDLRRGVYQCIKYKAVFKAQRQIITMDMKVTVTLVLEKEAPAEIRDLAKRHDIELRVVKLTPKVRTQATNHIPKNLDEGNEHGTP